MKELFLISQRIKKRLPIAVNSTPSNAFVVGAVFQIIQHGKIDQKWIDEICE